MIVRVSKTADLRWLVVLKLAVFKLALVLTLIGGGLDSSFFESFAKAETEATEEVENFPKPRNFMSRPSVKWIIRCTFRTDLIRLEHQRGSSQLIPRASHTLPNGTGAPLRC
jgi:hypothetical protein